MKELENEYRKRLNYYKGQKENNRYIDSTYDRVFGPLHKKKNLKDNEYEGVYSGTEENIYSKESYTTPYAQNITIDKSTTPQRVKYKGINNQSL
mmetsp:Transcript_19045/g.16883  ORF Transcript_19045/g.16883 Transcript_19045/m.16883 type:complete len:94 (+) Transcript_19045:539-820(+)